MFQLFLSACLFHISQESVPRSVHGSQALELGEELTEGGEDAREARRLESVGRLFPALSAQSARASLQPGNAQRDFVVFGYLQSETQVFHTRWHALTHVGSRFVSFDGSGSLVGTGAFTGRSSYLKQGGAAEAAGVKVILVVNHFDDAPGGVIQTVMTSAERRGKLAREIAALLALDPYADGVSMDLEFSWGPVVRDGVTAFMASLRAELDARDPSLELSIYTGAIFSASQWDFDASTGITPSIDYMLYSMYDWATGLTPKSISDFDACIAGTRMPAYLADGLPPEKLVPVVSIYSRRWNGTSNYGVNGSAPASSGFTDALFDVTLNPNFGGPYFEQYQFGDEAGWYTWNDGVQRLRTWEAPDALAVEFGHVLSMQDPGGNFNGRRLGGIGFWSLFWMAESSSVDPRSGLPVSRTRTYPHVYQLAQELFAPAGESRFLLDGFAGFDFRWRDPNESPDTLGDADGDSELRLVAAPAQLPPGSGNAMEFYVDVEGSSGNVLIYAHELLASPQAPLVPDLNALLGHFDISTELGMDVVLSSPLPGSTLRFLLVDAAGQLEASPAYPLGFSGLRHLSWDLGSGAVGRVTLEPALLSGNGLLATAGAGARDIGFYGIAIESPGPLQGSLVVDNLGYRDLDPGARAYCINEFRYHDASLEFVELYGPAGAFPAGMQVRVYSALDGSVLRSFGLTGIVPDDGGGQGFYVIGDPGVVGVDDATGFGAGNDDLPNLDPSALQLIDGSGHVYDSVVSEAFGGLDGLARSSTRGVASRGQPWLGEVGPGLDTAGQPHSAGRFPDGVDRGVNALDFSLQAASPGEINGARLSLPLTLDFEVPQAAGLFQSFDAPSFEDPLAAGLPASLDGGLAWRCVDPAGGGVLGWLGDASLGALGAYIIRGEVYVPGPGEAAQALAVGLAGNQGSNFFTSASADASGYESGYWLIYENRAGVGLADGRADHPGVWELVHATHDNQDGLRVQCLASLDNLTAGVTPGGWTSFSLALDPAPTAGAFLQVRLAGEQVFAGSLAPEAPRSGAFQVGFRENHAGGPGPREGTWIDALSLRPWRRQKLGRGKVF